ncbi:MAG: hypothetical protein IBX64_12120 [Actinobacteria bacterium]|nr:hypothetical protein [Actinomycetota bacterium]
MYTDEKGKALPIAGNNQKSKRKTINNTITQYTAEDRFNSINKSSLKTLAQVTYISYGTEIYRLQPMGDFIPGYPRGRLRRGIR